MTDRRYTPIACSLHDELQLLVLRGRQVPWSFLDEEGHPVTVEARATDVVTRDGAEWVVLDGGRSVRLDRLTEVDGRPFTAAC